ncbi:MAG: DUF692 domain-containing protein [Parachlamydiaceae bacterium]|nr:DUF692 domain-containing protein [Parachlamydiaceae bacterium]
MQKEKLPNLGIGIGFRDPHYEDILRLKPNIDWFEIISENFLVEGGKQIEMLDYLIAHYPVVQHGVSLAIGSSTPLDYDYLKKLKMLARKTKTPWISDHLCWGQVPGAHFHDLLPLPYTKEVIKHVSERARIVQDYLEIPFALENLSSYVAFKADEMTEWDFYSTIVEEADIYMMLDVNNIYVSSQNHGFNPKTYYQNIPMHRVLQIHLAGHRHFGDYILDTHDQPVCQEAWNLYSEVYPLTGGVSTLLEWDDHIPSLEDTWNEALKAKQFQKGIEEKQLPEYIESFSSLTGAL